MVLKIVVLCVAIASVKAGVIGAGLRLETPIVATAPAAVRYEILPTTKVEHVAPVVSTSYGYSTVPLKHEVIAPAVKIAAPVPAVHVQAPAIHVQTPAITRVEHLAPAVASSYRTEVINAPKVHITHTPAVAKIEHVPTIAKIEHIPTIAKIEHAIPAVRTELLAAPTAHVAIAQPALRFETPAITKVEHLAPAISSFTKTELVSAPAVRYETHHAPLLKYETPVISKVEHLAPAIAKAEYIAQPAFRVASFDSGLHGVSLKHFGHGLVF